MEFELVVFDPKTASDDEWRMYFDFRNQRLEERNPGEPRIGDEELKAGLKEDDPMAEVFRYLVLSSDESKAIGNLIFAFITKDSPSYQGNEYLAQVRLELLNRYQRQGIGTKLLETVVELAKTNDKRNLIINTEEDSGKAFFKKIGAEPKQISRENRLNLKDLDWDMMETWVQAGRQGAPATKMIHVTSIPQDTIELYSKRYTEVLNQVPFDDVEIAQLVITPDRIRQKEQRFAAMGGTILTSYTMEEDGDISGLTELIYLPSKASFIEQDLTGVVEQHRGKGLGKWLKAANITEAKKRFPAIETVVTGNAGSNAPMLHINEIMGFYQHKEIILSQIDIKDIEKQIVK